MLSEMLADQMDRVVLIRVRAAGHLELHGWFVSLFANGELEDVFAKLSWKIENAEVTTNIPRLSCLLRVQ